MNRVRALLVVLIDLWPWRSQWCFASWRGATLHLCERGKGHRGQHWCSCGAAGRRPRIGGA